MLCNYQSLYSRPLRHKIHTPVHTTDELVRLTYHDIQHSGEKKTTLYFRRNKYSADFRIT